MRRREDERASLQHVRQRSGVIPGVRRDLGERHVPCGFDEAAKLPVGDRGAIDPETADPHRVSRAFLRVVIV
jgi:hypothetical protein